MLSRLRGPQPCRSATGLSRDRRARRRGADAWDPAFAAWRRHFAMPPLRAAFAIGFLILFVFVGVFTYVNLYLVNQLGLSPMSLGLVYLVFAPAIVTTPLAGRGAAGPRRALTLSLSGALARLALTLSGQVWVELTGLALIGAASFAAQAAATGFVTATGAARSGPGQRALSHQLLPRRAGRRGWRWARSTRPPAGRSPPPRSARPWCWQCSLRALDGNGSS